MERRIRLLLACLATTASALAQVTDDFTDGDFTTGTIWSGSTALFTVVDDAGNQRLRSNSAGAANYYLSTPSSLVDDAYWELFLDLRFATSGANYVDLYLMSSAVDLSSGVNGYFLRIGGTADRLELFRSDAGTAASIGLQSPDGVVNSSTSNPFRVKVTRSAVGLFTLQYDDGATGNYTSAGGATDATYTSATHFGLRIEQSSAASVINNHFFDDIVVDLIPVDNTPPLITSVTATSATEVDVLYSEPLDPAFIGTYDITPSIGVSGQVLDGTNPALVHVTAAFALTSGNTYDLLPSGARDPAGNVYAGPAQIAFSYFVPDAAQPGDVLINEIMADPTPVVGLPDAEFVEIVNVTTDKTFDLEGWIISDGSTNGTLPAFMLSPGEHAIIVDDATAALFSAYPNVILVTTFPSLNNDGDPLELRDAGAVVINAVPYSSTWYQDAVKAQGGWTLERIDPTAPCSGASNWKASNHPSGGTPSAQNSVYAIVPDNSPPTVISVQVDGPTSITVQFSEAMDVGSLATGNYTIAPAITVTGVLVLGSSSVQLTLGTALTVGTLYGVVVTQVSDCPGNPIGTGNTAQFALPEPVAAGDVVINEVLYDPVTGGSDFVELYNRSSKTLSVAGWMLANVSDGVVGAGQAITASSFILLPGEYVLVTENAAGTASLYPQSHTDRFIETDMPSYNNGNGSVVLLAPDGTQLDRFDYDDNLHFALVNKPEGFSLERVSPDRPTSDNTNWQTASDVAGRATPGFQNSQYSRSDNASGEMSIEPAIFSPDNDGYQDVLTIAYRFDQAGFVGTMRVHDLAGREVRRLMDNQLLGTDGAISWDGISADASKARMGPYIVVFEVFDLDGNTELYKKTVTLAHRLD